MTLKIFKIVVSGGYGDRQKEIQKIKSHMEALFNFSQKMVVTSARKGVAKYNLKKGDKVGLKITLRKDRAVKFIKNFLNTSTKVFSINNLKLNVDTFNFGISSHRKLRLEKYNINAPEYGFNVAIQFSKNGTRNTKRKFNSVKNQKLFFNTSDCINILKSIV